MAAHLRLYQEADEAEVGVAETLGDPSVRVRLGDLLPLVAMAQKLNFLWLKDFLDDEVAVTTDLHQVLQTFRGPGPRGA